MAGGGQGIDVHGFHINGKMSRRLCGIYGKGDTVSVAKGADLSYGKSIGANVGYVCAHNQTGVGANALGDAGTDARR